MKYGESILCILMILSSAFCTVVFLAQIYTAMNSSTWSSNSNRLDRQIARKSAVTTCNIIILKCKPDHFKFIRVALCIILQVVSALFLAICLSNLSLVLPAILLFIAVHICAKNGSVPIIAIITTIVNVKVTTTCCGYHAA